MLQKLLNRAQVAFAAFHALYPHVVTLAGPSGSDQPDELEILGGRKSVINCKSPTSKSCSNSPAFNTAASSLDRQPYHLEEVHGDVLPVYPPEEALLCLSGYYNALGHSRMGAQMGRDFDMTLSSFIATTGGHGDAQETPGAVHPFFQQENQTHTQGHYLSQQGTYMQGPIHQPQQLAPNDDMTNERTQDDIWEDFMGHLGLTRPSDE